MSDSEPSTANFVLLLPLSGCIDAAPHPWLHTHQRVLCDLEQVHVSVQVLQNLNRDKEAFKNISLISNPLKSVRVLTNLTLQNKRMLKG